MARVINEARSRIVVLNIIKIIERARRMIMLKSCKLGYEVRCHGALA